MIKRHLAGALGVASAVTWTVITAPAPVASAVPVDSAAGTCSDVKVVFARGTSEAPGVGGVGQAFVDSLRSKVGAKTVGVYAVKYPASLDFPTGVQGVNDAVAHVEATATNCPNTKIVLGGFSQGAAIAGFVTSDAVPPGVIDTGVTGPMPPAVADHVAAVTLFGTPSNRFMGFIGQPYVKIGPLYQSKTLESCAPGDPICSEGGGGDGANHDMYIPDGLVDQAATYAASRV